MGKVRFIFALWMAKCARIALRMLKRNASYFPGKVAITLCPDFLGRMEKPEKIIAVTGTNGKTTVCNMVVDMLEKDGKKCLNNRLGSNVNSGIASSLAAGSTLFGKTKHDIAVFEVDERSSLRIYPYIKPDIVVITNLFRDSINRNGHPQYIADILAAAIPATAELVLNADDLISCSILPESRRAYFGIAKMDTDVVECVNHINDMQICPKCSGELVYEYRRYHHIGRAKCADCGFASPESDYLGSNVDRHNMTVTVSHAGEDQDFRLIGDGVFNIYNVVTVAALFGELGYSLADTRTLMDKIKIVESRFNSEEAGAIRIISQMGKDKNGLATSRAFDYIASIPGKKEIILMNHCREDAKRSSENMSWLYECDFEFLNSEDITHIVATGPRAKDFYLRLLMAGIPEEKLSCDMEEMKSPDYLALNDGETVCIVFGTDDLALVGQVKDKIKRLAREAAAK